MLLRGKFGTFIVVERSWYDSFNIRRERVWTIVREDDDREMLHAMASLTNKHVKMEVTMLGEPK